VGGVVAAAAVAVTAATPAAAAPRRSCTIATAPKTFAYEQHAGVPASATSLDVWAPTPKCRAGSRRAPVVLWVHGGGYRVGDKRNAVADKVRLFNARGWVFVSVNYRLTKAGVPSSAHYPDHFRDVAAAIAWTRAHASAFGGNPHRLAVLGHSAGADIVSNVITNPWWLGERGLPLRAVRCAGPLDTAGFDKTRSSDDSSESAMWRVALGNAPNYKTTTSATLLARAGTGVPPTITVVRGVSSRRSIETDFAAAIRRAGAPATVIDARSLTHEQVNRRIGAPGDTVMTPPLMRFLRGCFQRR
jgi:acetyl esterase/lipase